MSIDKKIHSDWHEYQLMDIAELYNTDRAPLSKRQRLRKAGPYPYYGASGIVDYIDDYKFDGCYLLISEDGENLRSRNTPIAFEVTGQFWVNNHSHVLSGRTNTLQRLIRYYFELLDLTPYITGAVQPKLSKGSLLSIPIYLPSSESMQRAIAEILGSLDDKIDLLRRQNATLEGLAEVLFRQWFVEGVGEEMPLSEFVEINPREKLSKGIEAVYLEMRGVSESSANPGGWYRRAFTSGTKFRNGDALLARITPCLENGKRAYVQFLADGEVGWGSTEFLVFRTAPAYDPFMAYGLLATQDFRTFAEKTMTGSSGRQRVQTESLFDYALTRPPGEELGMLNEQFARFAEKLRLNGEMIGTLAGLRDVLLPGLMSGEVGVETDFLQ